MVALSSAEIGEQYRVSLILCCLINHENPNAKGESCKFLYLYIIKLG